MMKTGSIYISTCEFIIILASLLLTSYSISSFVDHDMFMRFRGGGIGHKALHEQLGVCSADVHSLPLAYNENRNNQDEEESESEEEPDYDEEFESEEESQPEDEDEEPEEESEPEEEEADDDIGLEDYDELEQFGYAPL